MLFLPENFMSVPVSVVFGHRALGVGAGIWERTKGLLNHHIAAATARDRERETLHCFPLSDFFFFSPKRSLLQLLVTFGEVRLYKLQLISSLSLLAFSCLTPGGS